MAQRIVPNIWCTRNAEEAGAFYAEVFPRASAQVVGRYPTAGLPDFQQEFAGEAVTVDVDLDGYRITLINAGDEFRPNASVSFLLNADPLRFGGDEQAARRWVDDVWARLSDGGEVRMPLAAYPHSSWYGWVEDRYGVNWQLMLTDPAGEPAPAVIPVLLFANAVQGRAEEAIRFYAEVLPGAVGRIVPYPQAEGTAAEGEVMWGDFRASGQTFAAMDSRSAMEADFSPGFSFAVDCDDQAEIDRLWDAMSAVPEAEACGWLTDRFGVSWQIVPADMAELMSRPDAYAHMMRMKKLVIADF